MVGIFRRVEAPVGARGLVRAALLALALPRDARPLRAYGLAGSAMIRVGAEVHALSGARGLVVGALLDEDGARAGTERERGQRQREDGGALERVHHHAEGTRPVKGATSARPPR